MSVKPAFDFIVIGAMRSGTTTLHHLLKRDKRIVLPINKEAPFFTDEKKISLGLDKYYKDYFKNTDGRVIGKVSPQYMAWPAKASENISRISPDSKIIAILRDPVERLVSHYCLCVALGLEKRSLQDAVSDCLKQQNIPLSDANFTNSYIMWSKYGEVLSFFYKKNKRENLLVLGFDELQTSEKQDFLISRIYEHIGLDFSDENMINNINTRTNFTGKANSKHLAKTKLFFLNLLKKVTTKRMSNVLMMKIIETKAKSFSPEIKVSDLGGDLIDELNSIFLTDAKELHALGFDPYWINN